MSSAAYSEAFTFSPNFGHQRKDVWSSFMCNEKDKCSKCLLQDKNVFGRLFAWVRTVMEHVVRVAFWSYTGWKVLGHWRYNRLKNYEVDVCRNAFRKAYLLENGIIQCSKCNDNIQLRSLYGDCYFCSCGIHELHHICINHSCEWVPLVEEENIAIFRKRCDDNSNNYMYKVKGYIEDFSARDFLRTLMDVDYRVEWDKTALEMKCLREENTKHEVVYWKMRWPTPHLNRDYVYQRRYGRLNRHGIYIVQNKAITHPFYPEIPNVLRIKDYRSTLAINPIKDFKSPGLRYSVLYYEDPGEPYTIEMMTWFVKSGLNEFMTAMSNAAVFLPKSRRKLREFTGKTKKKKKPDKNKTSKIIPDEQMEENEIYENVDDEEEENKTTAEREHS